MKIGFIGLGQMGRGMASRLVDSGHQLQVWNRSRAAAEAFAARGAVVADTPAATLDAEVVISMLADDAATAAVWIATGLVQRLPQTTLHLINYGRLMLENPDHPTFTLKLGLKDVALALQTAADLKMPLPTATLLQAQHQAVIAQGYGERDWAALGTYIMDSANGRIRGQSEPQQPY